ncbi:MAG: hypothetical protein RR728_02900, partial [Oscillospiraceae bacterium]
MFQKGALTILESYDGTIIPISNCNCGYGGTGPHNTKALLEILGVSTEKAEKMIKGNAIIIKFDNNGDIINLKNEGVIESRVEKTSPEQVNLSNIDYCDLEEGIFYFLKPSAGKLTSLLRLLDEIDVNSIEYYIGEKAYEKFNISIPQKSPIGNSKCQPVLQIYGSFLTVSCILDPSTAKSFINIISMLYADKIIFN